MDIALPLYKTLPPLLRALKPIVDEWRIYIHIYIIYSYFIRPKCLAVGAQSLPQLPGANAVSIKICPISSNTPFSAKNKNIRIICHYWFVDTCHMDFMATGETSNMHLDELTNSECRNAAVLRRVKWCYSTCNLFCLNYPWQVLNIYAIYVWL